VPFFTWVKELTDVKGSSSAAVTVEDEAKATDQQMFATGRTAMCLSWSNQASSLDATSGQDLEMLRVPSTTGKFTDTASRYKALLWSVSARAKPPEAAAQVIDVLVNQPTAVTIIKTERGMPPHQVRVQRAPGVAPVQQGPPPVRILSTASAERSGAVQGA